MTKVQRIIFLVTVSWVLLLCLCPPYYRRYDGEAIYAGHRLITSPPGRSARIDIHRLGILIFAGLVVGGTAFFMTTSRFKSRQDASAKQKENSANKTSPVSVGKAGTYKPTLLQEARARKVAKQTDDSVQQAPTAHFSRLMWMEQLLAKKRAKQKEDNQARRTQSVNRPTGSQQSAEMSRSVKCPKCSLISPPSAMRCDCGYDFSTNTMQQSYLKTEESNRVPVRWLKFWMYVRLPLGVLIDSTNLVSGNPLIILHMLLIIAALVGLSSKRKWGWAVNWFVIGIEWLALSTTSNQLQNSDEVLAAFTLAFMVGLIWVLPNSIYFYKRRILFN